jgi:hypothetical protein
MRPGAIRAVMCLSEPYTVRLRLLAAGGQAGFIFVAPGEICLVLDQVLWGRFTMAGHRSAPGDCVIRHVAVRTPVHLGPEVERCAETGDTQT